jgi:hypothetical protein
MEMHRLSPSKVPFNVLWSYDSEDSDMKEAGVDLSNLLGINFIFVAKPQNM